MTCRVLRGDEGHVFLRMKSRVGIMGWHEDVCCNAVCAPAMPLALGAVLQQLLLLEVAAFTICKVCTLFAG